MIPEWVKSAIVYHIYPLGLCDAPLYNDFQSAPVARLALLHDWLDHIQRLGANTIYLGPVFESTAHGYDTANYFTVDRRLGSNDSLRELITAIKQRGMRIILDGVFNHVGRDFWAFRDVLQHKEQSPYCDWFANLNFHQDNAYGDGFSYEGWAGHYDLVKLNLENLSVRQHLFDAVSSWIEQYDIDGLRLDAADAISFDFLRALRQFCAQLKSDFWLMGEVVHGDYRHWANTDTLHSSTNYELYKGLYSSHVDVNYFEIAYSLNRQFGEHGIYKDLLLYNFADNHDVNRVASNLTHSGHLYPVYGLLFTMPGIPSIYYGSEWGLRGKRTQSSDRMLRPALQLHQDTVPEPELSKAIQQFATIRHQSPALKEGTYRQLYLSHEQFAFERKAEGQIILVLVNASENTATIHLEDIVGDCLVDLLNQGEQFSVHGGSIYIDVYPHWLRILQLT